MTRKKPRSAQVEISQFSKKGHGLGHTLDEHKREVEVPFTIPGDVAEATLYHKRKGICTSHLDEIVHPSKLRISPRCIHFGTCGGCRWQQMDYPQQLAFKQDHIEQLFRPLMEQSTVLYPIISCDPPWHYRNKMEFSFSNDASGNKYLGLIIDGSRGKVLNITECHLADTWFIQCLQRVREWWMKSDLDAYHPHSNRGSLRTLTLRQGKRTGDRLIMLTVSGNPDFALHKHHLDSFVAAVRDSKEEMPPDSHLSIFLCIQQAIKGHATSFYEMLLYGPDHIREILHVEHTAGEPAIPLEFSISPAAFFQPNTLQAERLYSRALQLLEIPDHSVVFDLYCGTGTLGICAANKAKKVIGIEISAEAVLDAKANVDKNRLSNVDIHNGSVAEVISGLLLNNTLTRPDVVMVDPPRMGLDAKTLEHLSNLRPSKLLYISCNPATQAENIKKLQAFGYQIKSLQPVDQFPHTVHIENIAILTLK